MDEPVRIWKQDEINHLPSAAKFILFFIPNVWWTNVPARMMSTRESSGTKKNKKQLGHENAGRLPGLWIRSLEVTFVILLGSPPFYMVVVGKHVFYMFALLSFGG